MLFSCSIKKIKNMIIATCGHDVSNEKDYGTIVALADYSREGGRAVSYPCVCEKCLIEYQMFNSYLHTNEDVEKWLLDGVWPNSEQSAQVSDTTEA
jgi:hypothetical protein